MTSAQFQQQHEQRIARRASAPDAVNLFHDPAAGGRKPGPHRIGCVDDMGNKFPSISAAAAAHGCSVPNVLYKIRCGVWRYA